MSFAKIPLLVACNRLCHRVARVAVAAVGRVRGSGLGSWGRERGGGVGRRHLDGAAVVGIAVCKSGFVRRVRDVGRRRVV